MSSSIATILRMNRRDRAGVILASVALLATAVITAPAVALADTTDVLRLSTGETLMVDIVSVDDDIVTFRHPALGTMTVPRSAVAEIIRALPAETRVETVVPTALPPAPAPTPPAPAAPAEPAVAPEAPAEEDPKRWKFRLTFAGGGAAGNTENVNALLRFRANRESEETRTAFDASYFYGSTDGDKTDNRVTTGLRHDWLLPKSRWFIFAEGRYDYDEFQSWLHRVQGFGGVGYHLIKPPKFALDARAGLGAIKEWKSNNDDVRLEGLFGFDGIYDVADDHQIVFSTTIFPDLGDNIGDFRWVNSFGWRMRLNSKSPLALSAGLEHEYQSQVDPGRDKNDVRVFAGLDWDF